MNDNVIFTLTLVVMLVVSEVSAEATEFKEPGNFTDLQT